MTAPAELVSANAAAFARETDNVFARIADRYDFLCDVFSLYAQRYWKARMAALIAGIPAAAVLDIASGTGDIPARVLRYRARRGGVEGTILVTDTCEEMLAIARRKIDADRHDVVFRLLDAHYLDGIESESIDLYSISFGMKICDRSRVLAEAWRVLKPGGRFFCLEASHIPLPWVHRAYLRYMDWCMPLIARIAAGRDKGVYEYLLRGIHGFPDQEAFTREIEGHGFRTVTYRNFTFGVVALHQAIRPSRAASLSG